MVLGALLTWGIIRAVARFSRTEEPSVVVATAAVAATATSSVRDSEPAVAQHREVTVVVTAAPAPPQLTPTPIVQIREVTRDVEVVVVVTATPSPPQPTPTASPVMIVLPFDDSFDDGPRPEWESELGTWRMVDGTYATDGDGHSWAYTMVGDPGWQDYAVEVDVVVRCISGYPVAVLLRSSGPGEGMRFQFDCCDMEWIISRSGQSSTIAVSDMDFPKVCGFTSWKTSRLRLEADGNMYSAYLNGELIVRVQDDTFAAGRVGLGTTYSSAVVRFDNLLVASVH